MKTCGYYDADGDAIIEDNPRCPFDRRTTFLELIFGKKPISHCKYFRKDVFCPMFKQMQMNKK